MKSYNISFEYHGHLYQRAVTAKNDGIAFNAIKSAYPDSLDLQLVAVHSPHVYLSEIDASDSN